MPGAGKGGNVVVVGVFTGKPLAQQPFKASLAKFSGITVQEIVSHLIHNDTDNQTGRSGGLCGKPEANA
jgi:hypothetical protein